MVQTLCTSAGPGSAELAAAWANAFEIVDTHVWGDTTDYMFTNFAGQVGAGYPNTVVVELDTMEIRSVSPGGLANIESVISTILAEAPDPCSE